MKATALSLTLFLATLAVPARLKPPSHGVQLANVILGDHDIRFPLILTQCEPVFIYYNMVSPAYLRFETFDRQTNLLNIYIPAGAGYIEWICDIPADDAIIVSFFDSRSYVVRHGSSSSCLSNVTSSQHSSATPAVLPSSPDSHFTVPFPTGYFSTINVYPRLVVESPTFPFSSSLPTASITATSTSHHLNTSAIAGGTVGGVVVLILTACALLFILRRDRSSRQLEIIDEPIDTAPTPFTTFVPAPAISNWSSSKMSPSVPPAVDWHPSMLISDQAPPISGYMPQHPQNVGASWVPNARPTEKNRHPTVVPYDQYIPSFSEPTDPPPNPTPLASSDSSQPEMPITSSSSSKGVISSSDIPNLSVLQESPTPPPVNLEHDADVVTALHSFSRMNPTQRTSLVSMLNTMVPVEASTSNTGDVVSHPPPSYTE